MTKNDNKNTIGPVQLLVIGFSPEANYEGKILKELERLDRLKTIRILDLLFVKKDTKSNELVALSIQEEELGAIIGALMGFEFKGEEKKKKASKTDTETNAFGLSTTQIAQIGESLAPGMAAGVLLIEHVWARELKHAIRSTGGVPLAEGFLTPEALAEVVVEVKARAESMDQLEEEESQQHTRSNAYM